jgi:hypothetical protein
VEVVVELVREIEREKIVGATTVIYIRDAIVAREFCPIAIEVLFPIVILSQETIWWSELKASDNGKQ